ncbi:MAG TPA: aminoglycoside phosphotransferase family protein [Casimicrobiaceae bacterium]|nr:aminoglycoside phosphotransferase family protein [Casimicrobiaceae bacterium]
MHDLLLQLSSVSTYTGTIRATPLAGGVSSDIYRIDLGETTVCVKRALARLNVAAEWHVKPERNAYEAEWFRVAAAIDADAVPRILAEDRVERAFAMTWLPPERFPVWKSSLLDGVISVDDAARVGDLLGRLHAATANRADLRERFATDGLFHALRLEPYLYATATRHPDVAETLRRLALRTANERRALVHGDFSPKNLLLGADGPVVLDAECAWYGDPAFDLAFVLNHLLLKGALHPAWRARYRTAFAALVEAYRERVRWEPSSDVEMRAATLLPALMLARVDGKSPVEYLDDAMRETVRRFARDRLATDALPLLAVADLWTR